MAAPWLDRRAEAAGARLVLYPRAGSALCVWERVAMLWVAGSCWRFSRLAAVACGPVAAGDLAACDGDGRCWGGMVAPDGVAARGKPIIDGGMAGAGAGSPLADAGVPAPGGLAGRADLDFAAGQVRWRVQDQRAGVCADLQHDSAGLGGTGVFIGHVRTFPRRSGHCWGAGMVIGPSARWAGPDQAGAGESPPRASAGPSRGRRDQDGLSNPL